MLLEDLMLLYYPVNLLLNNKHNYSYEFIVRIQNIIHLQEEGGLRCHSGRVGYVW
jgi:hypothetical protein